MHPTPNRSRLLRFPEGTLINHKYLLVSPGDHDTAASRVDAGGSTRGAEIGPESPEEPPSSYSQHRHARAGCIAPLGQGGSSVVFLARQVLFDAHSGPQCVTRAVKFYLLSPTLARHCEPRRMQAANAQSLRNEVETLTSVQHANVLQVIDTGVCERSGAAINYLVTEYVPGPTLAEIIACGAAGRDARQPTRAGVLAYCQIRRNPTLVVQILGQLCGAIEHLHGQGIYHCDIAPKNVLIHPAAGYRPILGDFALGWRPDRPGCCERPPLSGALRYAPPARQQLPRSSHDAAALREFTAYAAYWDVYGFAKSALELASLAPADGGWPWKNALVRYLHEAMVAKNGVTAAALHRRLSRLL